MVVSKIFICNVSPEEDYQSIIEMFQIKILPTTVKHPRSKRCPRSKHCSIYVIIHGNMMLKERIQALSISEIHGIITQNAISVSLSLIAYHVSYIRYPI